MSGHSMKLSVLILTHHRREQLRSCLESVRRALPRSSFTASTEILVVLNGEDPDTLGYLREQAAKDRQLRYIPIRKVNIGHARNSGIIEAKGEYVLFLDDDTTLPEHYFMIAERIFAAQTDLDVLGGPDAAAPCSSSFQKLIDLAQTDYLATGPTRYRHSPIGAGVQQADETKLILCNLWIKRSIFRNPECLFKLSFERNEENILLSQIELAGGKLRYSPELFVYHERKKNLHHLVRSVWLSGKFRAIGFVLFPRSFRPHYLIPVTVLATELLLLAIAPSLALLFAGIYVTVVGIESLRLAIARRFAMAAMALPVLFPLIHLSYAIGTVAGFVTFFRYKEPQRSDARRIHVS